MGRYYNGDIEGKFWFGVQSSNDIENLVMIEGITCYTWHGCGCAVDSDDLKKDYCANCYAGRNAFLEDAEQNIEENGIPYYQDNEVLYELKSSSHLLELEQSLRSLSTFIIKDIMDEFNKVEQDEKITNALSGIFNMVDQKIRDVNMHDANEKHELAENVARYGLGLQAKYCLTHTGSCSFYAEL